jgi:hydrogenase nickel incorporation protein HypA/HybF
MHELSIAMGIVKIAEAEARKAGASAVEVIELEIGTLAGIELESLDFVWPLAVRETVLEKAEKRVQVVQGRARCLDCDTEYEMDHYYDPCPHCSSNLKAILQGKELRVRALEVV